jgi:hypothetical protein
LLHLVGIYIYLYKMHGHPNVKNSNNLVHSEILAAVWSDNYKKQRNTISKEKEKFK